MSACVFDDIASKNNLSCKYILFYYLKFYKRTLEYILGKISMCCDNRHNSGTMRFHNTVFSWNKTNHGYLFYFENNVFYFNDRKNEIRVQEVSDSEIGYIVKKFKQ